MGKNKRKNDGFHLPFHSILAPCWLHFNSILTSFCLPFWSIWPPFEGPGEGPRNIDEFCRFCGPSGLPFGSILAPNSTPFSMKKLINCLIDFRGTLAPFWLHFLLHFPSKIGSRAKKVIFWKWAFRLSESSIFEGRGRQNPSKSLPEVDQKNDAFFHWKSHWKRRSKGSQKEVEMPPKTLPKTRRHKQLKETSKNKPVSAWNGKRGVCWISHVAAGYNRKWFKWKCCKLF